MAVLNHARRTDPDLPVIVITAHASIHSAVDAMRAGAYSYLAKPYRIDEVRELVARALELVRLRRENQSLRQALQDDPGRGEIISRDPAMARMLATARQAASTQAHILIGGASGTGKELLARYIHQHSPRRAQPFVAINCAALPDELLASELFGHEKGAFTGAQSRRIGLIEAAHGGSLFLDEIGEMSLAMQVKLLRVIQESEVQRLGANQTQTVDVRWIAATHRDLQAEIQSGRFRQDLYFRLHVVALEMPPLAARRDDIPLLASHFLQRLARKMQRLVKGIDPAAMDLLQAYAYPGNVRELENIIERSLVLCRGEFIQREDLPDLTGHCLTARPSLSDQLQEVAGDGEGEALLTLAQQEERHIRRVLEYCAGNRSQAAKILGIDRATLWRKLKGYAACSGVARPPHVR
jgi:DNA-binding NtrC family response regulator